MTTTKSMTTTTNWTKITKKMLMPKIIITSIRILLEIHSIMMRNRWKVPVMNQQMRTIISKSSNNSINIQYPKEKMKSRTTSRFNTKWQMYKQSKIMTTIMQTSPLLAKIIKRRTKMTTFRSLRKVLIFIRNPTRMSTKKITPSYLRMVRRARFLRRKRDTFMKNNSHIKWISLPGISDKSKSFTFWMTSMRSDQTFLSITRKASTIRITPSSRYKRNSLRTSRRIWSTKVISCLWVGNPTFRMMSLTSRSIRKMWRRIEIHLDVCKISGTGLKSLSLHDNSNRRCKLIRMRKIHQEYP